MPQQGTIAPQGATGVSIGLMVVSENGSSSTSTNLDDKDGKFALFVVSPGLVYLLGNPFRGDWQIQPKGFVFNAQLIRKYGHVH